ncbi:MFS transporter [Longispora sp. NPDC051575]|uniref:MFS transporter n=1 Tax=Longispora sp. NPDC051575 TaxID=3154943 RepID=UPI00342ADAC5
MVINRNYTWLWVGRTVSTLGDVVFDTTVLLWVATVLLAGRPSAPLVSGAVLAVVAGTVVLVGPVAGALVDRWPDKRRTMLSADLLRAGLIGALTLVAALPDGTVPLPVLLGLIGVLVAASTAVAQFFNAARFVLLGDVVPADLRGRAAGYHQAVVASAALVGPPLAGPLLFAAGPQWALAANAASFLVSYAAIRAVRVAPTATVPAPRRKPSWGREYLAGFRFVARDRILRAVLLTRTVAVVGAGAVTALDVYFVAENLRAEPRIWFGVLSAALGLGALAGGLVGGRCADRYGPARVYAAAVLANGALLLGYSRADAIGPALVLAFCESLTVGVLASAAMPLFQRRVPRDHQGRVSSVLTLSYHLPALVSASLAGLLVSTVLRDPHLAVAGVHLGRIDTVFGAAALLVLAAGCYAARALRTADTPPRTPPN